jgi:hypothetical protein
MKFRVRSAEGELDYESFGQVEQAWLMGLVEPSDELLEEGKTHWRRADSYPLLVRARRNGDEVWGGAWFLWALIGIAGATWALYLFQHQLWLWAMLVSFAVAVVLIRVTTNAQKRRNPHGAGQPTRRAGVTSPRAPPPPSS